MKESLGMLCFRLFEKEILHYKRMFESVESQWKYFVTRNTFFDADFRYVSTLPTLRLRTAFWVDKIAYMRNPIVCRGLGCVTNYWYLSPDVYSQIERELLDICRLLRISNPQIQILDDYPFL